MPVRQVEHVFLGAGEPLELRVPPVGADRAGLEVLAAEEVVDVLQPHAPEGERDAHAEQLIRARVDERVLRARRRRLGSTAARQNASSSRRPFSQ